MPVRTTACANVRKARFPKQIEGLARQRVQANRMLGLAMSLLRKQDVRNGGRSLLKSPPCDAIAPRLTRRGSKRSMSSNGYHQ